MRKEGWRQTLRLARARLAARVTYFTDGLLGMSPPRQLLVLLLAIALFVLLLWGAAWLAFRHTKGADVAGPFWVLTLIMDGGTMAGEKGSGVAVQLFAFITTVIGVFFLSMITAAFASKMGERLQDLRSGHSPVVERDHVLVLGFDRKVPLIARELARSRRRLTLVVLTTEPRERVDAALRPLRRLPRSRVHLVVRNGDPRSEHALQMVAAARARLVLVLPPPHLQEEAAVRWTLAVILAVRQTTECGFRGHVIAETPHEKGRDLLLLAAEPGVAGPDELPTDIVATDDIIARMLAQSVRREGIYHVLRRLLAIDDCEIFLDPVPRRLLGRTFDGAHEAVDGAVLLGVRRDSGALYLNPAQDEGIILQEMDRLVVIAAARGGYGTEGRLPVPDEAPAPATSPPPERVALLGASRGLPRTVRELARWLPPGSSMRVIGPPEDAATEEALASLPPALGEVRIERDGRAPLQLARDGDEALYGADAVVILGASDADEDGDARALSTLLTLRHGARSCGRSLRRVVTEVRDPRSAHQVAALTSDMLVGSELVALLLAQQVIDPQVAPVYGELLSPWGNEVAIEPRTCYVGDRPATFADVAAAARQRGEIAIGLVQDGGDPRAALELNPPRDRPVPAGPGSAVVVIARPAR